MAKGKTGPPYIARSAEYIVITCPWGMNRVSKNRLSQDFDRLAAWIEYILRERGIHSSAECIFSMNTRDEVIVQLPYGTDIQPLFGQHIWALISKKWDGNPNDPRESSIFEYNFRNNGDPANHNWADHYPNPLPQGVSVPAKSPYPQPGWTDPPTSIRSLVLPIPPPPLLPVACAFQEISPPFMPAPPSPSSKPTSFSPSPKITCVFKPYEPPTQHTARGAFTNQTNQSSNSSIKNRESPPPAESSLKYLKKLDPYQEEEDAQALLRTPSPDDFKPIKQDLVKRERDLDYEHEYQPSAKLTDTINSLIQNDEQKPAFEESPFMTPRPSTSYQPSAELMDAIDSLIHEQSEEQKVPVQEGPIMISGPSTSYRPSSELMDAIDSLIQEQDIDRKPMKRFQRTEDYYYQPSAELADAINGLRQQNTASEEEQKPVLDPRAQKKRKFMEGGHSERKKIKFEDAYDCTANFGFSKSLFFLSPDIASLVTRPRPRSVVHSTWTSPVAGPPYPPQTPADTQVC